MGFLDEKPVVAFLGDLKILMFFFGVSFLGFACFFWIFGGFVFGGSWGYR